MNNAIKKWYSLFTRPGCEKKVANLLSRKNIVYYLPLKRKWNGRKKVVLESLFNSYVFVQIADSDMQKVRMIDNVVNVVHWLGKPAVIRDEEIEIIKRFVNEYDNVKLEKMPFEADGTARVIMGLQQENKANMLFVSYNQVKIVLPSLGYMMIAEVEKSNAEIITSAQQSYKIVENYKIIVSK